MGIYQNHGDAEIYYIYEKFVRYCLLTGEGIDVSFYSGKDMSDPHERYFIKLKPSNKEKAIIYQLNYKTRLFEEIQKNKSKEGEQR